jgi:hypothetical protein
MPASSNSGGHSVLKNALKIATFDLPSALFLEKAVSRPGVSSWHIAFR